MRIDAAANFSSLSIEADYSPDEPRDNDGKWTSGPGGSSDKPAGEWSGFPAKFVNKISKHQYVFDKAKKAYVYGNKVERNVASVKDMLTKGIYESLDPSWQKEDLLQKVGKPQSSNPQSAPSSSPSIGKGLDQLSPEAKALHASLPDAPVPHDINGDPLDLVNQKKFTSKEQDVVDEYKGEGISDEYSGEDVFHTINEYLYKGGEATANDRIKKLDSAVAKCKTKQDVTVWRNMGDEDYATNLRNYLLDEFVKKQADPSYKVIHAPSCFQSTSTDAKFAHDYTRDSPLVMQLHLPKGSSAIPFSEENELVLDRTAVYTVNKLFKAGGKLYADCDVSFKPKK